MDSNKKIWLASPKMEGNEFKYVSDAFEENWVAPVGPHLAKFENLINEFVGVSSSVALTSGTAAIHLALILLGIKKEDEVLCSTFTFCASANPIIYQGAKPIFIDSEKDTWNMCPVLLEEAIQDRISKGKKPKACILVHLYGSPAKMKEICEVLGKYKIPLVEDAAEALGSRYNGQMIGSFGELSIFSFNGNKIITTSGGGALVSNNDEYINEARFLSTQAKDRAEHYEHSKIGYNYRLSNVSAGIGRGQMEILDNRIEQKRSLFKFYKNLLVDKQGVTFLEELEGNFNNQWLICITLDSSAKVDRFELSKLFAEDNIESRPLWKPMHLQEVFKDAPSYVNGVSEKLFNTGICLPSDVNMGEEELERVSKVINRAFQ